MRTSRDVPSSLRAWFFVHFLVDYLFAIPLFLAPRQTLTFFGWSTIDPLATRLVAAALFGIGGISFLARNTNRETYATLLLLKLIWSLTAILGVILTILQGAPPFAFVLLLLFVLFSGVWIYYAIRLRTP